MKTTKKLLFDGKTVKVFKAKSGKGVEIYSKKNGNIFSPDGQMYFNHITIINGNLRVRRFDGLEMDFNISTEGWTIIAPGIFLFPKIFPFGKNPAVSLKGEPLQTRECFFSRSFVNN